MRPPSSELFFYGTLMDGLVRAAVLGRELPVDTLIPATLAGWRRMCCSMRTYPVLVQAGGGRVNGLVARDLTPEDIRKLSRFEGPDYRLRRVIVALETGGAASVRTFLPASPLLAGERPWDYRLWRQRHRRAFLIHIERRGTAA